MQDSHPELGDPRGWGTHTDGERSAGETHHSHARGGRGSSQSGPGARTLSARSPWDGGLEGGTKASERPPHSSLASHLHQPPAECFSFKLILVLLTTRVLKGWEGKC